jgi:hypothetical protein
VVAKVAGRRGGWLPLQRAGQDPGHQPSGRPAYAPTVPARTANWLAKARRACTTECALCERVCFRARKRGIKARTVTLKLRYADFQTLQRSRSFTATASERDLYPIVCQLYRRARTRPTAIRLLGIGLSNLQLEQQLSLFDDNGPMHRVVDGARERYGYGYDALHLALAVRDREEP